MTSPLERRDRNWDLLTYFRYYYNIYWYAALLVKWRSELRRSSWFCQISFCFQSHVWGVEAKLGITVDDNWMYTSGVIQLCMKIHDGVGGHLVFWISGFWAQCLVAAVALMLHTKFGEDRPYHSEVISIYVSYWKAWEREFLTIFGVKKFLGNFLTPQRHLLGPNRFFWRINPRISPWPVGMWKCALAYS